MKNVKSNVLEQICQLDLKGKKVAVAFSGGSDSVCLLHTLFNLSNEVGFTISAVHINHHLRGEESDGDAAFAKNFCDWLKIPIDIVDVDVKGEAKKGESTELAARRLRYDAFEKVDADFIATAHNADDAFETFIINFSRGSGLGGLIGIPTIRDKYIRPLIYCTKRDVLNYCDENGLSYVTDSSNLTDDYTRNKIRHHVIPEFEKVFPDVISVAKRNFELLKRDNDYLKNVSGHIYSEALKDGKLDISVLKNQHVAIASRVIIKYCNDCTAMNIDNFHLECILDFLEQEKGKIQLFNNFYAVIKDGFLFIKKDSNFQFDTETEIITIEKFYEELKINNLLIKNAIDYDKIMGQFIIRTRISTDRLRPKGRGLSKPLRKLQSEQKIDSNIRDIIPVAVDDEGVIWSYLSSFDERVAIDKNTKNVLVFKVYKRENRGQ